MELIIEGSERRFRRNLGNAIVERSGDSITTRYVYTDHLGSVDVITNAAGALLEKLSFDAFGKRRAVFNQSGQSIALNLSTLLAITLQGFTGHQQVDHAGIVQMGGRIYDSHIGRFLQADPFVQSPSNSQNFNRYSYVLNNPLSYTDPSGYFHRKLFSAPKRLQRSFFKAIGPEFSNLLVGIASMACGGFAPACATYGSYQVQRAHGATPAQARKGAAITGASVWAFQQIGGYYQGQSANNLAANTSGTHTFGRLTLTSGQIAGQITAHAMVGGVAASLQGGKFGHGFFAAGFAKGLGTHLNDHYGHDIVAGTATSAVVGGTASVIAGGKFANGAVTGAFQALYNQYRNYQAEMKTINAVKEMANILDKKLHIEQLLDALNQEQTVLLGRALGLSMLPGRDNVDINKYFISRHFSYAALNQSLGLAAQAGQGVHQFYADVALGRLMKVALPANVYRTYEYKERLDKVNDMYHIINGGG